MTVIKLTETVGKMYIVFSVVPLRIWEFYFVRQSSYIQGENYLECDDVYDDDIVKQGMEKVEKLFKKVSLM